MNLKYFVTFTTIVLATGLSQPITPAQTQELVITSRFNNVLVSQKKNPSPPRPSPPGGSRLAVQDLTSLNWS
jgi:hypothetical protein